MNSLDQELPSSVVSDTELQEATSVLGHLTQALPEDQLKHTVTEIHFLAESWLDEFERSAFGGKTLEEIVSDRSSL